MTRWSSNPPLAIGAVLVLAIVLVAAFHPLLSPYAVEQMDMRNRLSGPTLQHWLGTDNFGRDLWTRLAHGSAISLAIALGSVAAISAAGSTSR
jgi:peptide/nickel transport system permease protein